MRRTLLALFLCFALNNVDAAQTRYFVLDTPKTLAGATGRGVAIYPDGSLAPLPPLTTVASFDEPLGLALAVAPDGSAFVGTGHPARVWRVKGAARELVAEPKADQITALLLDPAGTLWAATASPALLLRFSRATGSGEQVARLGEGNLWDLAWFHGALVAAAGSPGRLFRFTGDTFEQVATVPDRHARCLAVSGDALLIGTSGKGLVLRWGGEGAPAVLYDSTFTEIAALAVRPDGIAYAAGLTGDPSLGKPPKEESTGEAVVSVSETTTPLPPTIEKGPTTSEIIRILPVGAATVVHRFAKAIAGTLAWGPNGLVVGTGLEGELWQLVEGSAAQLDSVDAAQVVRVLDGGEWVLTQGPVKLMRRSGPAHGTFTSPALDAGQPARFGEARLQGQLPASSGCSVRFRSGAIAEPDESWSPWSTPAPCGTLKVAAPPARFLQWRVELAGEKIAARIGRVEVAYRHVNLPPEVKELTVHSPGEVFLKTPPPSDRVIEVQHPDLSGIFTTIDEESERQPALGKKYYRVGFQSVSWKVEDANGDPLRFVLEFQQQGRDTWRLVRRDLETTVLAIDTQALADGQYRFRLTASDAPANPDDPATTQMLSSWFVVDNTPPVIGFKRAGDAWLVTVEDALSRLVRVEWNRDADEWHALVPDDGLLDGRSETFHIAAQKGSHILTVRAVDDHFNRVTVTVEELP